MAGADAAPGSYRRRRRQLADEALDADGILDDERAYLSRGRARPAAASAATRLLAPHGPFPRRRPAHQSKRP